MMFIVIWKLWKQPVWLSALIVAPFVLIELIFLSSNLQRVWQGGFVPLALAAGLIVIFWTWVRGTRILADVVRRDEPVAKLFETLSVHPPHRVRGTAIFLTSDPDIAPAALMHNLKHNQVLHDQIILLTVKTLNMPRAPEKERAKVEAQIGEKLAEAEAQIAQTKAKALASVNDIATEIAGAIVAKLIGKEVSKDEVQKALVRRVA